MKAIVLALEDTGKLWPLPAEGTTAALPLLGCPLLAWSAQALRRAGADRLLLALPEGVQPPEQRELPMAVHAFPAGTGTAQALLRCASDLEGGDFLAVSGDMLWTLDLTQARVAHKRGGLPATLVAPAPAKSRRDPTGRVLPFPEQPPADSAVAILSPAIFAHMGGSADLFGDVLPRLSRAGLAHSLTAEGCCHRLDSVAALLRCSSDLLAGKCGLYRRGKPTRPGVWSASPIPEGVELVPPCRIGANVVLGRGSLIGPHVYLEDGVTVGDHSLIQRSILQAGVRVGNRATVYGAIVCRDAALGSYAVLNEGAAVGPAAVIGDNVILMEGVGVGAGLVIPPSLRLTDSVTEPPRPRRSSSTPDLTVEDMLRLGRRLGRCGSVGAGGAGFLGLLLARAFGCGAAAQGAAVVFHDGVLPAHAAWLARYYRWPASVFVDEDGGVYLYDREGQGLTAPPPDGEVGEGAWDLLAGTASAYAAARERETDRGDFPPACTAFHHKKGLDFL